MEEAKKNSYYTSMYKNEENIKSAQLLYEAYVEKLEKYEADLL